MSARSLSKLEAAVVDKHCAQSGMADRVRVRQWDGVWSVYYTATDRMWVHNDTVRKQAHQELYFYSKKSVVGTLTCSHPIKLWDERRHLSARETARLQGFPDSMVLPNSRHTRLLGNAVCVGCAAYAISRIVCAAEERVRHVDLCAGVGGFAFALASVLATEPVVVGFSEIVPAAVRCYQANFPEAVALGDARTASWPECDLLTAGFPCQPFSCANSLTRRRTHTSRDFYKTVLDAIRATRATRVVLENVMTLQTVGKPIFDCIIATLQADGFHVSHQVLNSLNSGVPQARKRLYIVASKLTAPRPWDRPAVATGSVTLADILDEHTM